MDKVTRQCPQITTFLKREESRSGIEPRSFRLPLPNALPLGQTGSPTAAHRKYFIPGGSLLPPSPPRPPSPTPSTPRPPSHHLSSLLERWNPDTKSGWHSVMSASRNSTTVSGRWPRHGDGSRRPHQQLKRASLL